MAEIGVIHGRFQVLHLKHIEYMLAAKMHCQKLYIGITHQSDLELGISNSDKHGIRKSDNPLTYLERYEMIHDALLDFGVKREEFEIVPFPITKPEYITQYTPKDAVYYFSICNCWGEKKLQMFKDLGLKTEVLWRKEEKDRGITGTEVRTAITHGESWQQMVPKTVYEYMVRNKIDARIKDMAYLTETE